jgi:NPCBM/NEW2 domain
MGGLILLIAAAVAANADPAPEMQVTTVDGQSVRGQLYQLWDGRVHLSTASLPMDQVLSIVPTTPLPAANEKPTVWIELVDGSKLTGSEFKIDGNRAAFRDETGAGSGTPTELIRSVRLSNPNDSASLKWPVATVTNSTADLLVVRKKDQLDFMEGVIGNVDDNRVALTVDGVRYPVNRAKVDGLIFFHKEKDKFSEPAAVIETVNGWRLKAKELSLSSNNKGFDVNIMAGNERFVLPFEQIAKIDCSPGKIAYLSDLEPASVQWTPYFDFRQAAPAMADFYAPRNDEGREHQSLRLGGKTFSKGLALCSRTAIDFRIPEGMKKFKATAGIDDAVRDTGNVRLKISADGKSLFDQAITGKDAPADLNLDVDGAKRLSILVDFGDGFDAGDYLDLAEARMVK